MEYLLLIITIALAWYLTGWNPFSTLSENNLPPTLEGQLDLMAKYEDLKKEWAGYKEFLENKYPPDEGKEFEFTCEYHERIDKLLQ